MTCPSTAARPSWPSNSSRRSADMNPPSETLLIDRLRSGDAAALEDLIERYASRVFRVARGITRTNEDAEEVVQDVFLTLARKIDTFEGRAALLKCRGKRARLEVSLEEHLPTYREDGHREGERSYLLADWSRTPEAELLESEAHAVLSRAIDQLPEAYRAVLILREVEELSNEETARILDESVSTIKSRLHRAR